MAKHLKRGCRVHFLMPDGVIKCFGHRYFTGIKDAAENSPSIKEYPLPWCQLRFIYFFHERQLHSRERLKNLYFRCPASAHSTQSSLWRPFLIASHVHSLTCDKNCKVPPSSSKLCNLPITASGTCHTAPRVC